MPSSRQKVLLECEERILTDFSKKDHNAVLEFLHALAYNLGFWASNINIVIFIMLNFYF